jgi:phosphoenolpyruvate carboxykinase (GTP)
MSTSNQALQQWIDEVATLTRPDRIHWCDGSDAEYQSLVSQMLENGDLLALNQDTYPNCYLHRSDPSDVARVEHLTFVCTPKQVDAGPNNNWMHPDEAHQEMDGLFQGCMQGRTMYVIPYCMGPIDSPYARCGVEITDSPYVVVNMKLMTRMGKQALDRIEHEGRFVRGLHSVGTLDPDQRFIMHFPEELLIQSFGSGYGGNALLGKKCHALRIASWQARREGWLAEHMLIVEIESPAGEKHYLAAAFPSACGKTNLAMLIPPESHAGWKVRTLGDDIAWLHMDEHGQLRAINPESGYFGVVPGTNRKTNRNAYDMIQRDTIFTNVAVTALSSQASSTMRCVAGFGMHSRPWLIPTTANRSSTGRATRSTGRAGLRHTQTRALQCRPGRIRATHRWRMIRPACPSARSFSVDGGGGWPRWSTRPTTGSTAYWSARPWRPKRPRRPPARSASPAAIRWP